SPPHFAASVRQNRTARTCSGASGSAMVGIVSFADWRIRRRDTGPMLPSGNRPRAVCTARTSARAMAPRRVRLMATLHRWLGWRVLFGKDRLVFYGCGGRWLTALVGNKWDSLEQLVPNGSNCA